MSDEKDPDADQSPDDGADPAAVSEAGTVDAAAPAEAVGPVESDAANENEAVEPAADPDVEPDVDPREAELEAARAEIAEVKDKLLRAMAEMENLRRRGEREKADLRKFAVAEFARDILSIPDNLRRALDAVPATARQENTDLANLLDGVELTERELHSVLERHDIEVINPVGERLDPNLHQAMVQVDHPEAAAGTVVEVLQIGYRLHDRLLRAAMVAVAKGPGTGDAAAPEAGQQVDTTA